MTDIMRTIDVLAGYDGGYVLIERLTHPRGLALPGGKIENGESPESAVMREFKEETGLSLSSLREVGIYEGEARDPRFPYSRSIVFRGRASGVVKNEAGKTRVRILTKDELLAIPIAEFAFDHGKIVRDLLS